MPPKKAAGKKPPKDPDEMKKVDREFYEIEIQELNRKNARLQAKCAELEAEAETVRNSMEKMEADRSDVISHLKKTLNKKIEETTELTERIEALAQAKETEGNLYKEKIKYMESEFKQMQEQLSSEIKLLNGKLNSLEEFRANREELMQKFENQEAEIQEKERLHDEEINNLEQGYLIRKEQLKEEMEARLMKLSLDFQNATQMRIASTTQAVIRENIAVNNELNILVAEWIKMSEDLDKLREENKDLMVNSQIEMKDKEGVRRKNIHQSQIISQMAMQQYKVNDKMQAMSNFTAKIQTLERELEVASAGWHDAQAKLAASTQTVESLQAEKKKLHQASTSAEKHAFHLEQIIAKAVFTIKEIIQLSTSPGMSEETVVIKRSELLKVLEQVLELGITLEAKGTIGSEVTFVDMQWSEKFRQGDLGIVPRTIQVSVTPTSQGPDESLLVVEEREKNYTEILEEKITQGREIVKEIQALPRDVVKWRKQKEEIVLKRTELISTLKEVLNIDNVPLITPRPLRDFSVETMVVPVKYRKWGPTCEDFTAKQVQEISLGSMDWVKYCREQQSPGPPVQEHPSDLSFQEEEQS